MKIENSKESDSGQYTCYVFPQDRSIYDSASIEVEIGIINADIYI